MIIDISPKTHSELFQLFNPHAAEQLNTAEFKKFVRDNWNAAIEQEHRPDAVFGLGWTAEFDNMLDLLNFCNRFDI